jgi:uncharacterized protein YbjQ (UPF0145 family)
MPSIEEMLETLECKTRNDLVVKYAGGWNKSGEAIYNGKSYCEFEPLLEAIFAREVKIIPQLSKITPQEETQFFFCTTPTVEGQPAEKVFGLVSADCVYGMNIFRDIFAAVRDIVGGRSKASENVLRDAKITVRQEMIEQALNMGANAIVGVHFDFSEISGVGSGGMLLVSGTGTAVKLKDTD